MTTATTSAGTKAQEILAQLSLPPTSLDAERVTIGALLIEPERYFDVAATLRPDDFHEAIHRDIYAVIVRLHEERRPVDFITVSEALRNHEKLRALGGSAYLAQLC